MTIGIIGGSGLYTLDELAVSERACITTEWGEPSSLLMCGTLKDTSVIFLARHGEAHKIPPHRINYRANISSLKQRGVTAIFAINVVGGINGEMCPGDVVIPDQIIDYTWGREHTYSESDKAPLQHIDFTEPYDQALRAILLQAAISTGLTVHAEGVYGATQGPRLESAAEISRMANDGCDIVGMTGMPEAALARELAIPYACLALVVNMAAGLGSQQITMDEIEAVMAQQIPAIRRLLLSACELL